MSLKSTVASLWRWLRLPLGLGAGVFLLKAVYDSTRGLDFSRINLDSGTLALATLAFVFYLFCQGALWSVLLKKSGVGNTLWEGSGSWCVAQAGKYIPGKIFMYSFQIAPLLRQGVSWARVSYLLFLETVMSLSGLAVAVLVLLVVQPDLLPPALRVAFFVMLMGGLLALHPRILGFFVNILMRLLKRTPIRLEMSYQGLLLLTLGYAANYLVFGASAFWFSEAIAGPLPGRYAQTTLGWAASGLAGSLAFFVPAGIGVREAALSLSFKSFLGPEMSSLVSLLSRLWITASEILLIGFGLLLLVFRARGPWRLRFVDRQEVRNG